MDIGIRLGGDVRPSVCAAIDAAHRCIDAEFFSIDDPSVVASLNRAAARGVRVRIVVEGDPHRFRRGTPREPSAGEIRGALSPDIDLAISRAPNPLVHAKALVIDDAVALIGTANPTVTGLDDPGDALVIDSKPDDVRAVAVAIDGASSGTPPLHRLRPALDRLLDSSGDARIASEDLSDARIERALQRRAQAGRHDRVLVNEHPSKASRKIIGELERAGVAVRSLAHEHMHGKLIDTGDQLYVGSGNLTLNGIDEADEIGIVTPTEALGRGDEAIRDYFDDLWQRAEPVRLARG